MITPQPRPDLELAQRIAELERDAVAAAGTNNQRARYAEGLLPEDELLAIARSVLYRPFDRFTVFSYAMRLKPKDCAHIDRRCRGHIDFETRPAGELTADEYEVLADIRGAAMVIADHNWITRSVRIAGEKVMVSPEHIRSIVVEPTTHWGTCRECKRETLRSTARVYIIWAGRSLCREYRLTINR